MKAVRRALPVVLMVWPYLFILYTMLPDGFSESVYIGFLISYIILTVVIYALNIWNAFTYQSEDAEYKLAFYDMMIKIVHIPFYLGVFAIGVLFIAAMVVPALLFFFTNCSVATGYHRFFIDDHFFHIWNQRCCQVIPKRNFI